MRNNMIKIIAAVLFCLMTNTVIAQNENSTLIRLVAGLDEPEEFYCFDLEGWRDSLKLDNPIQAHTCKVRNAEDQLFYVEEDHIKLTEYDRCLAVSGSGSTTLSGSSLLARECDESSPLQKITLNEAGQVVILDTDYCIVASAESAKANGPSHLWRSLRVANCDSVTKELSTWQLGLK